MFREKRLKLAIVTIISLAMFAVFCWYTRRSNPGVSWENLIQYWMFSFLELILIVIIVLLAMTMIKRTRAFLIVFLISTVGTFFGAGFMFIGTRFPLELLQIRLDSDPEPLLVAVAIGILATVLGGLATCIIFDTFFE